MEWPGLARLDLSSSVCHPSVCLSIHPSIHPASQPASQPSIYHRCYDTTILKSFLPALSSCYIFCAFRVICTSILALLKTALVITGKRVMCDLLKFKPWCILSFSNFRLFRGHNAGCYLLMLVCKSCKFYLCLTSLATSWARFFKMLTIYTENQFP